MTVDYRLNRDSALDLWRTAIAACDGIVTARTVQEFAALVQAAERERCAQVADGAQNLLNAGDEFANGWCSASLQIAQAIRA